MVKTNDRTRAAARPGSRPVPLRRAPQAAAAPVGMLPRGLAILELLATAPDGLPLAAVADRLGIPRSATHRLLQELIDLGYLRQTREYGEYALTIKLVSLGLGLLGTMGIVGMAQPILQRLATESGELVRLAVLDGERLTWVAKAQGAGPGLRYDPDMGAEVWLSCSATGHAWLMALPEAEALQRAAGQGYGSTTDYGPAAPQTPDALLACLRASREAGVAMVTDMFSLGMSSLAVPVGRAGGLPGGVLSIAGPSVRLTPQRMQQLAGPLRAAARELAGMLAPALPSREGLAA